MLQNIHEVLVHASNRYGDRVALLIDGRTFTFRELNSLADRLAHALNALGVGRGDRVTLYAPNRWEWIVSYYGALKTGAVINPLNVMLTPDEVRFVANDCGTKVVLANKEKGEPILDLTQTTGIEHVIIFGDDVPTGAVSFDALIRGAQDHPYAAVEVPAESMSTIGYTSGTTGHPKGAMLSHRTILLNTAMTAMMHVRTTSDIAVNALPCAHVYGNVIMNGALWHGMKLVLHSRFEPEPVLHSIQEHRATIFDGVPTMYMYMLADPKLSSFDLSSLTRCTVGGQTMPVAKMTQTENRFGCPLIDLWGMTELGGLGTTHPLYGPNRHGSIGIALPYNSVRIADVDDAKKTMAPDEPGEIMFKGPLTMLGYYGNEAATQDTIEPDGWLHTGDIGRMDADGYVYIVDRKKDMILTAGYNVYPAEIERVLAAHESVAVVAVGSIPDETKGELAKAYIIKNPGAESSQAELIAFCRERLAAYKVPRAVQFVDALPTTSTGKIMRRELRKLDT